LSVSLEVPERIRVIWLADARPSQAFWMQDCLPVGLLASDYYYYYYYYCCCCCCCCCFTDESRHGSLVSSCTASSHFSDCHWTHVHLFHSCNTYTVRVLVHRSICYSTMFITISTLLVLVKLKRNYLRACCEQVLFLAAFACVTVCPHKISKTTDQKLMLPSRIMPHGER